MSERFAGTMYKTDGGNMCFYGVCKYFCDDLHSVCAVGELLETSLCAMLPTQVWTHYRYRSPWRRSYTRTRLAGWEREAANETFCDATMNNESIADGHIFRNELRLLDMIDISIIDFLICSLLYLLYI